ncbi:hypothetical protein K1719_032248 [Acacia pycnantha]|nr:hypothetical protein K1719_032248 [Acacia pycnantha]
MGSLIARRDSQKKRLHVEFDANMNHIGQEEDNFISYLGYLARSKVRIVYSHWKLVPPKAKELIWAQILQTFDVPNNKPPARPPRHQKWKAARMKGDKYINADVAEVA